MTRIINHDKPRVAPEHMGVTFVVTGFVNETAAKAEGLYLGQTFAHLPQSHAVKYVILETISGMGEHRRGDMSRAISGCSKCSPVSETIDNRSTPGA